MSCQVCLIKQLFCTLCMFMCQGKHRAVGQKEWWKQRAFTSFNGKKQFSYKILKTVQRCCERGERLCCMKEHTEICWSCLLNITNMCSSLFSHFLKWVSHVCSLLSLNSRSKNVFDSPVKHTGSWKSPGCKPTRQNYTFPCQCPDL